MEIALRADNVKKQRSIKCTSNWLIINSFFNNFYLPAEGWGENVAQGAAQ